MSTHTQPKPLIVRLVEMLKEWGTLKANFDAKGNDEASLAIEACAENLKEIVEGFRADIEAAMTKHSQVCPLRQQLERIADKVADWHERDITVVSTEELLQVIEAHVPPKESAVQRLYLQASRDLRLQEDRLETLTHYLSSDSPIGLALQVNREAVPLLTKLVILASEGIAGKQPDGLSRIYGERVRQLMVEGFTPENDAKYINGELRDAAIAYLMICDDDGAGEEAAQVWPWERKWFKTRDSGGGVAVMRCLVKAGALIAAEIDRLSRGDGSVCVPMPVLPLAPADGKEVVA